MTDIEALRSRATDKGGSTVQVSSADLLALLDAIESQSTELAAWRAQFPAYRYFAESGRVDIPPENLSGRGGVYY